MAISYELDPRLNGEANSRWRIAADNAGLNYIQTEYDKEAGAVFITVAFADGRLATQALSRALFEDCFEELAVAKFFEETD